MSDCEIPPVPTKSLKDFASVEKKETVYLIPISETARAKKQVQVSTFKGKPRVDIREYYMAEDGEWKPTKKGISLDLEQWTKLQELIPMINEATESFQ